MNIEIDNQLQELDRAEVNPVVSIGLPVYNGENYLEQAIDCILNQSFRELELIICDNASTDGTEEIARAYQAKDSRVRYYRSETNIGAAPNFNKSFELARGEFFKWAAHDDLCKPEFVQRCVEVLRTKPDVVLCHCDVEWIDENEKVLQQYDSGLEQIGSPSPYARFRNLIMSDHYCFDVFGVIRLSALVDLPLIASYIGSDRALLAELGLKGRFFRVPEVLFLSRDHSERSMRKMARRDRGGWFDPRLEGRIVAPHLRIVLEYAKAILRSAPSVRQKFRCLGLLFPWILQNKGEIKGDLKHVCRELVSRVRGSSRESLAKTG